MSKRPAQESRLSPQKRPKVEQRNDPNLPTITSSAQLQRLLTFQQDAIPELRRGIASFKTFLDSIRYADDKSSTAGPIVILKEFLESQTSPDTCLSEILQTWNYAGQANNDALLSAVPSVLAVLLRTISSHIEFRELGSSLCRALLQQPQLKLFSRCLSSQKHKEHVISPSLRLVTEIVSFDGGTFAKKVYAARASLLDSTVLARNLALWRFDTEDIEHIKAKPSIRLNAIRLTAALLKYLPTPLKGELLRNNPIPRAIFEHCKHDHPIILKETLKSIKLHVCQDTGIPRSVKTYVLSDKNLCSLAGIFRQDHENMHAESIPIAKSFLMFLSTDTTAGVLRPSGWYPPGSKKPGTGNTPDAGSSTSTSLDSIHSSNKSVPDIPVRNTTLSKFAQFLRPYASTIENELLVVILRAAPELVADYFIRKAGFTFEPKLSSTWLGYAAFLFSVVRLPPPTYLGTFGESYGATPPPVSIVLENILPQPLSHKVLSRCLNQQHGLITLFVLRLLIAVFEKLQAVITHFKRAAAEIGPVWEETMRNLLVFVSQRCPSLREIAIVLKKTPKERTLQNEACLRLLKLYLEVFPHTGFGEKIDMSQPLSDALREISIITTENQDSMKEPLTQATALVRLNHVVQIARWTPEMKWWNRMDTINMSPYTALLRLLSKARSNALPNELDLLFKSITTSNQLMQNDTEPSSVDALIASLEGNGNFSASVELYEFLDDAFARLVRKPIKYLDDFDTLIDKSMAFGPISLIWMTLVEQWPHAISRPKAENIGIWLGRFIRAAKEAGEDLTILEKVDRLLKETSSKYGKAISHGSKGFDSKSIFNKSTKAHDNHTSHEMQVNGEHQDQERELWRPSQHLISIPPTLTPETALHRALSKSTEDAILEGDLGALLLCLSSEYPEVARQAYLNLNQFMHRLSPAMSGKSFTDSRELYLLLGILTNTVKPLISMRFNKSSEAKLETIPFAVTVYAAAAAHILTQPLHPIYSSVARFHTKSPKWDIERLASYWLRKILNESPEIDDGNASLTSAPLDSWSDPFTVYPFVEELEEIQRVQDRQNTRSHPRATNSHSTRNPRIQFLIAYITASLRSEADLQILRRKNIFEPLVTLVSDASLPRYLKNDVMKLIWRVTCIQGGSTMLITRIAILAWLKTLLASSAPSSATRKSDRKKGNERVGQQDLLSSEAIRALVRRVYETCDQEHVTRWAGKATLASSDAFTE